MAVKVIDNFIDKVYKHFEDKQAARTSLQEERLKLKKKEENEDKTLLGGGGHRGEPGEDQFHPMEEVEGLYRNRST